MSGRKSIAVFDVGTTAVKSCLFSEQAELLAISVREYRLDAKGDRVEAQPEQYWEAMCLGMADVLNQLPDAQVEAVGLTTQGETLVPVDAAGQPLRPFLVWLDSRAGRQDERLRSEIPAELFYQTTGLPSIEGSLPLAKLCWLRENEAGVFARTEKFLLLEDYLLFRFTGHFITEPSLQTSTGWFRLGTDNFWTDALAAAGISPAQLPELQECGSRAGFLTEEAAQQLGLPAGLPVFTGAMDQAAAALAAGSGNGVVTETTGTALVAAAVTRTPVFPREHPVTIYRHAIQGEYVCLPISNTAGMALRWFRDQFCPDLPAGSAGYAALDGMAAAVPPGCEGLIFLPYLSGCVDPDACPQARAMFFGATLAHTRAHFARAVLESTAFVLADFLEMLDKMGCPCRELRSLGGGASSALWQQIKADACGRQMTVPACREATAQGAALLAGRGSGIMPSHFVPTAPPVVCYRPDPTTASLYREARELTHQLYAAVRPLY